MNAEFMQAFEELGKEKGIAPEILFDAIEAALISAYKRNFGSAQNVRVSLDRITEKFMFLLVKLLLQN